MKRVRIISYMVAAVLIVGAISISSIHSSAESTSKVVTINGKKANKDAQSKYRGLGMVAGNGSSRLLLDYKDENPDKYWEIMNYLFNTESGMGLSHIKIEMGSDVNSSSGTEPSLKRTESEEADATRGANYQLAADAKTINPKITLDMLWWSEPAWVGNAKDKYAARYKWYKETLEAVYEKYALKFEYVSANRNERSPDTEWIIYLSKALKAEKKSSYDFSKIKVVASDENAAWGIADMMLKDKNLMKAVDVISTHYTSWSTANAKEVCEKYGKELWFGEGSSPMSYSQGTYRYDGTGTGLSDINGMLDIATRIITMYPGGNMNLYEFQPAVASYYSGSSYFPKQLITANEPWSGHYTLDAGFYMAMHFSQFAKLGWQYIDGACYGDGKAGGDGHALVDSTYNYQTVTDPKTGDYSVVIANNTAKTLNYTFNVSNLAKYKGNLAVWETRGPNEGQSYNQNYFKKIANIIPKVKNKSTTSFKITIKPYSMVTLTTLKVKMKTYSTSSNSTILALPYSDDFEYSSYDKNYLADRGNAPRYTTDEGGAFEVVKLEGNNVIQQKVTYDTKASDWGSTPTPVTNLGDDNWTNYSVSTDALFSSKITGLDKINYVGVGARYNLSSVGKSGYWLQLYEDGTYALNKNGITLVKSTELLKGFDKSKWNHLKLTVNQNVISCFINNENVITYTDEQGIIASGRVALYSEFNQNYFDNLKVEAISGVTTNSARMDDTDSPISYSGTWTHATMSSFKNYNRTLSTGTAGATISFNYSGEGFAVLGGGLKDVKLAVEIDGKEVEKEFTTLNSTDRSASYFNYSLLNGNHSVKITVISGKYNVDAIEIVRNSNNKLITN